MTKTEKTVIKWSKKEKDWIVIYPNRNGRIFGHNMFVMIEKFNEFKSKDWQGNPTGYIDFRQHLISGGFDPDTFTITVKSKL